MSVSSGYDSMMPALRPWFWPLTSWGVFENGGSYRPPRRMENHNAQQIRPHALRYFGIAGPNRPGQRPKRVGRAADNLAQRSGIVILRSWITLAIRG